MSSSGPASSSGSTPPASLSSVLHTLHSTYTAQQQQEAATAPTFQFATPPPPFPTVDNLQSPSTVPSITPNSPGPPPLEPCSTLPNLPNQAANLNGVSALACNDPAVSNDIATPPVPMSVVESTSDVNVLSNQQTPLPGCNIPQFPVNLHPPKWPIINIIPCFMFL